VAQLGRQSRYSAFPARNRHRHEPGTAFRGRLVGLLYRRGEACGACANVGAAGPRAGSGACGRRRRASAVPLLEGDARQHRRNDQRGLSAACAASHRIAPCRVASRRVQKRNPLPLLSNTWSLLMKTTLFAAVLAASAVLATVAAPAFASNYGPAPFYRPSVSDARPVPQAAQGATQGTAQGTTEAAMTTAANDADADNNAQQSYGG